VILIFRLGRSGGSFLGAWRIVDYAKCTCALRNYPASASVRLLLSLSFPLPLLPVPALLSLPPQSDGESKRRLGQGMSSRRAS
jgi:hypothetical protein